MKQNDILSGLSGATLILTTLCILAFAADSPASDLARERRLAEQTVDAIFDGEPLMLNAAGHEFLGIYTRAETEPERGTAIILHGRGTHPDWEQVAGPLRKLLPAHGWSTLSLQMPVLDKDASYYEYVEIMPEAPSRIEAALAYLRKLGTDRIILIAHSCSVHMSMAWIRQHGDAGIDAYVGIGMGATDYRQPMREPFPFDRIRVPLLNIYGEADYPAVQRQAAQLEPLLAQINSRSAQRRVAGADHYFSGHETELTAVISDWLDTLFPVENQPGL
jgi:pimeloyl-ACP methyl ester carboxylesterase